MKLFVNVKNIYYFPYTFQTFFVAEILLKLLVSPPETPRYFLKINTFVLNYRYKYLLEKHHRQK